MLTDKEVKNLFAEKTAKNPEQFYPVRTLRDAGFVRARCSTCKRFFWSTNVKRRVCGDASCDGGFTFIGNTPAKKKLSYAEVWTAFARVHQKRGYTPIKRYPVIARWNPTTDFTIASIAAFQPYIVTGEVEPPANPLVIPQFCLRFGDIDNVGITGSHYVGFVMMGQHGFFPPKEYDVNTYLADHLAWYREGMGLEVKDITIHEDFWAGGGNFGPSMEFFSRGLELSNQVYMQYEKTPSGYQELTIKVLDMGQGQERAAAFTHGNPTTYEVVFPHVLKNLRRITGLTYDQIFMHSFAPWASHLNIGEADDRDASWAFVAQKLSLPVQVVKDKVLPSAALYSIAEHARALLFALSDGGLPSNVGGLYNLRVILRRSVELINQYGWNIDLCDVCGWHAEELEALFPELKKNLKNTKKIVEVEKLKYSSTTAKVGDVIKSLTRKKITTEDLIQLYDSKGIPPQTVAQLLKQEGKDVTIPDNFYALVAAHHEQKESETKTERDERVPLDGVPDTKALYFDDWRTSEFSAKVLKIVDTYVVLDQTVFYPVSGGQLHDRGTIKGCPVSDVFKQGPHIIHVLEKTPTFAEGVTVKGCIDAARRKQLAQHHTSTHIVNAAARAVLGNHINQASAKKDMDKAYIDITHYQSLTDEELRAIENKANEIIKAHIPVIKSFMPRTKAEQTYGMSIYQGGAVPGKLLRIVNIQGVDVEACGGTHLNNTTEAESIMLLNTTKVKDGVIRLTFCAGEAARRARADQDETLHKLAHLLNATIPQIPGRAAELFTKWKAARKAVTKGKLLDPTSLELTSTAQTIDNVLERTVELLQTQRDHIVNVVQRMKAELDEFKKALSSPRPKGPGIP